MMAERLHPAAKPSLRSAINAKCRSCIYDPDAPGRWREQVAACCSSNCALHSIRPVPRSCMDGGRINPRATHAIADRLGG